MPQRLAAFSLNAALARASVPVVGELDCLTDLTFTYRYLLSGPSKSSVCLPSDDCATVGSTIVQRDFSG